MVKDRISFIQSQLAPWTVEGIEQGARLFNDRELRYERAYRYKQWRDEYPHGYSRELLEATK